LRNQDITFHVQGLKPRGFQALWVTNGFNLYRGPTVPGAGGGVGGKGGGKMGSARSFA
jgi:hypothetical protein